ncbi:helix-turn-helix domain-containing protein [Enterococcus faecium]|uniref:helix-turn-helix domain-containing protein n=1 Tax=Enterococcus faecium TaxID=1352 RepID=UPI0003305021|nr:helix-turn-helix transcriptional regulator [Enterococcus faecium]EOM66601.1 hypothetical protein SK9_01801 [Enterococcus faecium EnGen0163]
MEWRYIVRSKELRRRRIEMGVTTERMAEVLNIPEYQIINYENGERVCARISYELIEEMSWFLRCEVSDIAYERG